MLRNETFSDKVVRNIELKGEKKQKGEPFLLTELPFEVLPLVPL